MSTRLTRSMSRNMGIEIDDLVKGLKAALNDSSIIQLLRQNITDPLQKEIAQLKSIIDDKNVQIQRLEKQVDSLEQYSRRNSLRIHGLPENTTEDVCEVALKLVNDDLGVTPPISLSDIDRVHRIGPRQSTSRHGPRPVILKMATYQARARIYSNRAKLRKNTNKKVFINEDLTKARSHLLWRSRQSKKEQKLLDCWTHDGNVLVKDKQGKITPIADEKQLLDVCSI